MFCNGCKEILSSKKSILKNHLASKKHAAGKEKLKVTKKRDHVRTCVFAMLKTVRLEGGLYECSLKSKLIELIYKLLMIFIFLKISVKSKQHNSGDREHNFQKVA